MATNTTDSTQITRRLNQEENRSFTAVCRLLFTVSLKDSDSGKVKQLQIINGILIHYWYGK